MRSRALFFPPRASGGSPLRFRDQIRICCVICLTTQQETMDTSISPLLLCGSWTVSCAPGSHSTIVGFLDRTQWNSSGLRLLLQGCCIRKEFPPLHSVTGCFTSDSAIRFESLVGSRILPMKGAKMSDFLFPCGLLSCR